MRVKKFLYSLLLILVASFFVAQPVLAITQQTLEEFANNNIMFYDPGDQDIAGCYSSSANIVEETDRASIIWNWFVRAGIPGISNNAEVIAGILGNFQAEGGSLDPFAWEGEGHGYGLYRATGNSYFVEQMEKEFGGKSIWNSTANQSAEVVKRGIEKELEIIVSPDYNWNHSGFPDALDVPTNKAGEDGAAAYAELFVLTFERPGQFPRVEDFEEKYRISAFKIQDPGVASYEFVMYPSRTTNYYFLFGNVNGQPRRSYYAREFYRRFSDNQIFATSQTDVTGSDILVIGDETLGGATVPLEQTFEGIEVKSANNLSEVASTLYENSRKHIIISLDLSKAIITENDFKNTFADTDSSHLYFVANQSFNADSDYFEPNKALIASQDYQIINVSEASELAGKITNLFEHPVVTMCSSSSSGGELPELYGNNIETYAAYAQILGKLKANSNTITCPAGTTPVKNYAGTSETIRIYISGTAYDAHLCAVPSIAGSVGIASSEKGKTFNKCKGGKGSSITVPQQNGNGFEFETDIQKPAVKAAVFNVTVAQAYYVFGEYMKAILNLSSGLPAKSSYRSEAFQNIIHTTNPYQDDGSHASSCDLGDIGSGWGGAGGPKYSNHVAGHALDLDTGALVKYYNDNRNGFREFVDRLPVNHKCFYKDGKVTDIPSGWASSSSKGTLYNKFFCNVLPKFHLYFTVGNEDWHSEAKEN